MMDFFRAGGISMLFVLLFSLLTLGVAGRYAYRPLESTRALLQATSTTTLYAVAAGLATNLAAVFTKVPAHPEWSKSPDLHLIVMMGLGEALTVCIFGFTMLALSHMLLAIGLRRSAELGA